MINNPKIKGHARKAHGRFTPTFYRVSECHAPEPGLGGSYWLVRFAGRDVGEVFSTWDHEMDVHWRINDELGSRPITDEHGRPRRFETRVEATNYLLMIAGYRGDWESVPDREPAY